MTCVCTSELEKQNRWRSWKSAGPTGLRRTYRFPESIASSRSWKARAYRASSRSEVSPQVRFLCGHNSGFGWLCFFATEESRRAFSTESGGGESPVFFFQAEDGIRVPLVTGVQTCALPI